MKRKLTRCWRGIITTVLPVHAGAVDPALTSRASSMMVQRQRALGVAVPAALPG